MGTCYLLTDTDFHTSTIFISVGIFFFFAETGVRPTPRAGPSLCGFFFFYISYHHSLRRLRIVAWDVHGTGQVNVLAERAREEADEGRARTSTTTPSRSRSRRRGPSPKRDPHTGKCRKARTTPADVLARSVQPKLSPRLPLGPPPDPACRLGSAGGPPEPSGKRSRQLPPRGALSALLRGFPARRLSLSGLAHRLSDCLLCVPEVWAGVDSPPHLRVPHRQAQRCLRRAKRLVRA